MTEAVDIAIRELQHTCVEAKAYYSAEDRQPELLRSYANDLTEDLATVTQLKSSYGDRSKDILELVAEAKRVKRLLDKEAYSLEIAARNQSSLQQPQQVPNPPVKASGVKLPRIKLPTFDGESSDDFRGFIGAFNETISTEPDLSSIRKWLLLKAQLSGKALQMVKELPLIPETFDAGLKILEDAYGSSRRSVLKMYQRIQMLPNAQLETESLKITYAKLEGVLLSLKNLNTDVDTNDFLRAVVISKFPHDLLHLLKVTDSMTLSQFRVALNEYIQARDCVIQQVFTTTTANGSAAVQKGNGSNGNSSNGKILLAKAEVSESISKFMTAVLPVGNTMSSQRRTARAVLDTAASHSLITSDLAEQLGIENTKGRRIRLSGVQDATITKSAQATKLLLFPPKSGPIELEVFVVPKIVDNVVSVNIKDVKKKYPAVAALEMPSEGNGTKVQLLLGYQALAKIVTLKQSKQIEDLQLLSTKFGWIPFGEPNGESTVSDSDALICLIKEVDPIKLMCDLQQVGLTNFLRTENEEEEITLKKFYECIERIGKQYQIEWPYRQDPPDLDDNFGLAMGRLLSLCKQLAPTPDMLRAYDRIVREQVETDVVEIVNTRKKLPRGRVHYLPHRGIIRFGKSTPIRMVFDASSKCRKNAKSLNDNIYKGGNWVTDIPSILIRFRRYKTAVMSDVQRAFHQILIAPKDRDVTRFLWLRDINKPPTSDNIVVYRFKRMAFGIIASPFLLTATIKYHLRENSSEYANQIEDDMYADNLVVSLPNAIEPTHFYRSVKNTFADMGMNITQWCTDDDNLQQQFEKNDVLADSKQTVLGVPWNIRLRSLSIKEPNLTPQKDNIVTKRIALQEMAKVFDPLGWSIPLVLLARIFLRKVWLQEYPWDKPFPDDLAETWRNIHMNLKQVSKIQLPRAYAITGIEEADQIELHAFCDASAEAYGVVIYILVKKLNETWTGIVAAKSKLSPKTQLSIPRLELLAAVIGTRYIQYVERNLKITNPVQKYLWGDSRCVIAWTTTNKILPVFIEKAVAEIRAAKFKSFLYVPTHQNPADIVSRGAEFSALQQQQWWSGPEWLKNAKNWPTQKDTCKQDNELDDETLQNLQEETKILLVKSSVELKHPIEPASYENSPFDLNPLDFETFSQLFRRTAFCLKAAHRFLRGRGTMKLQKYLDYEQARIVWLRWDQQRIYKPVNKEKSNVSYLQNLKVKEDENGLLRCLTRIKWAKIPPSEAEPILLAKNTGLTQLIILSIHRINLHAGTAHTLAAIRKKYWLPHGRRQVYHVLKKSCFTCRRYDAQPFKSPEMAPMPTYRISRTETPFKNVGVDVFGPFKTKVIINEKAIVNKRWVIIFTCLVVRAIHLEILKNMTAEEFLQTLRRFVSRRGTPKIIVSDNAPQFKAVEGIFQCMWRRFANAENTSRYYAEKEIEWRFIPAHAPWIGGAYERMIRTVKNSYERVFEGQTLMEDQFKLAMVEIEAMVNSRPITYLDRDNSAEIVTPNDFLCVKYPAIPIDYEKAPQANQLAAAWVAGQKRLEEFWQLWSERYLREIRERRECMKNPRKSVPTSPVPGDLVLMVDPDVKRSAWRVAVVERVIKSADGEVRSAQIRTANRARMLRPVTKLAPLKLLMSLPENVPELSADMQNIVVDNQPGVIEL